MEIVIVQYTENFKGKPRYKSKTDSNNKKVVAKQTKAKHFITNIQRDNVLQLTQLVRDVTRQCVR